MPGPQLSTGLESCYPSEVESQLGSRECTRQSRWGELGQDRVASQSSIESPSWRPHSFGAHTLPFDGNPQPNPLNSDPWLRVNLPTNDSLGQAQYRTRWPTRLSMAKRANPMAPASVSTWAASAPGHSIVMGMTSMVVVFRVVIRCHSRPVGQLTGFGDLVCHASACVRASKCPT